MRKSAIDEIKEYLQEEIKRQESNMGYDDHSGTVLTILEKVIEIEGKNSGHQVVINTDSKESSDAIVKRILGIMPSLYDAIEIKGE